MAKEEKKPDPKSNPIPAETPLAKPADTAMTEKVMTPAEMQQMYGELNTDDISIPRLTVLQGLSPQVNEGLGRPGNLFITGLNRELGKEVEIIPLIRNQSRIRWKPLTEGGGILCQSFDAKIGRGEPGGLCANCALKDWAGSNPPACDLYENIILILRNDDDMIPMALSGSRTKLKAMRDLNTLFMSEMIKRRPLYMKSYWIKVVDKTSSAGLKYFSFRLFPGNDNKVLPLTESGKAALLYESIKHKNLKINQENETVQPEINNEL